MKAPADENELVRQVSCDDRKAYTALYNLYVDNLYRYIFSFCRSKETTEEIIQNIFVMIWTNRKKLDEINSFKYYIYRSAKNMLLNEIKRSQVEARVLVMSQTRGDQTGYEQLSDTRIIYNQYARIAQNAIDQLPEKRRRIFELRTLDDLSLDEIAEKLQISKSVVKKQLYSGRNFVREYLNKAGILSLTAFIISFFFAGTR